MMPSDRADADLELAQLLDSAAESLLSASNEEILEEARKAGEDPDAIAREQKSLFLSIIREHRKEKLANARADYERQASRIKGRSYDLPVTAEARLSLLVAALSADPAFKAALTVQHRDFKSMSDEDVQSYLRQLDELGILEGLKGSGSKG